MHVLALDIDLHVPHAQTLKAKRSSIRPIVDSLPRRFAVAVAEVDHHDVLQRSRIGVVAVSGSARHVTEIIDSAERYVWSRTDVDVVGAERTWMEFDR